MQVQKIPLFSKNYLQKIRTVPLPNFALLYILLVLRVVKICKNETALPHYVKKLQNMQQKGANFTIIFGSIMFHEKMEKMWTSFVFDPLPSPEWFSNVLIEYKY